MNYFTPQKDRRTVHSSSASERQKFYLDNIIKLGQVEPRVVVEKSLPQEFSRYTWGKTENPRKNRTHWYTNPNSEQGGLDGTVYDWYQCAETKEVFRVPILKDQCPGMTEVLLNIMAKAKEIAPWSQLDSLIIDDNDHDFIQTGTHLGQIGRSAVLRQATMENIVAVLGSDEYSQDERNQYFRSLTAKVVHESVHLFNEDSLDFGGMHRTLTEVGPQVMEVLSFSNADNSVVEDLNTLIKTMESRRGEISYYQEAIGIGILLLAIEDKHEFDPLNYQEVVATLLKYRERIASSSSNELDSLRELARSFCLSVNNESITNLAYDHNLVDRNETIFQKLLKDNSASWVRENIDPQNTLPDVNLIIPEGTRAGSGSLINTEYRVMYDGKDVGYVRVTDNSRKKESWIESINIKPEYRSDSTSKKGFGLSTYLSVIEMTLSKGHVFRTHEWSQTPASKHIWDILTEKGVAIAISPFQPDDHDRYLGHYEVRTRGDQDNISK